MRVKCLAQEHNTMTRPGLEPGPLDPESSALTAKPPRLPLSIVYCVSIDCPLCEYCFVIQIKKTV